MEEQHSTSLLWCVFPCGLTISRLREGSQIGDRLQHPHPIRRFPRGNHVVHTYVATASQHDTGDVLQESSTWIMRSWEQECSAVSERWVMCVKIRGCVYEHWQNVSGFMFCSLFRFLTSGWESDVGDVCRCLPSWRHPVFKAPLKGRIIWSVYVYIRTSICIFPWF